VSTQQVGTALALVGGALWLVSAGALGSYGLVWSRRDRRRAAVSIVCACLVGGLGIAVGVLAQDVIALAERVSIR
jgi:drug/metabolite transporter (DMT)-like permease